MLAQELEDIVAHEVLICAVGDAQDVGDTQGIELDGEVGVGYDKVLGVSGVEGLHLMSEIEFLDML